MGPIHYVTPVAAATRSRWAMLPSHAVSAPNTTSPRRRLRGGAQVGELQSGPTAEPEANREPAGQGVERGQLIRRTLSGYGSLTESPPLRVSQKPL